MSRFKKGQRVKIVNPLKQDGEVCVPSNMKKLEGTYATIVSRFQHPFNSNITLYNLNGCDYSFTDKMLVELAHTKGGKLL